MAGALTCGAAAVGVPFLVFMLGFTFFRVAELYLRPRLPGASGPVWLYPVLYGVIIAGVLAALAAKTGLPVMRRALPRPPAGAR